MSKTEKMERMNQLRAEVESQVKQFNELYGEKKFDESSKIREEIDKKVGEYTGIAKKLCYDECAESPDGAMMEAVRRLSFKTIRIKENKPGKDDGGVFNITVEEVYKPIDLVGLHDHCGGIGVNGNWYHIAQKMNFLLTAKHAKDLGITDLKTISDSYAMSEIAKGFDMGKDPTSKTNLLKTLNIVVSAMLGDDYKAVSHDVNFLLMVYAKKSKKALTVTCSAHRNFVGYIAEICHRIVTGGSYGVEYKAKK